MIALTATDWNNLWTLMLLPVFYLLGYGHRQANDKEKGRRH